MKGAWTRVTRIALTESARTRGSFDRKSILVLLVIGAVTGAIVPQLTAGGFDFDHGLYHAAVTADSPLLHAIDADPAFILVTVPDVVHAVSAGDVDVAIDGSRVYAPDSMKGDAALAAVRDAAKAHTFRLMATEENEAAAFPVRVTVLYLEQAEPARGGTPLPGDARLPDLDGEGEGGTGTGEGDVRESGASGGGGSGEPGASPGAEAPRGGFSLFPDPQVEGTPGSLAPPFPFRSLILAYLFLIPMNFVVQVYAGSMIAERLGRKGEALLASPARPWEIITGKTLPYFAGMMVVSAAIAVAIGGGWLTLLAVAPLALAFLAMEFVAAMFARSFRELTFLTVFSSVLLTIYAFLPAVFSNVHPIAFVSPITLIVNDLTATPVTLGQVAYATLPLTLASVMLFVLGAALYREEDLFHQKTVPAKAVDMIARQVRGLWSGFRLTFLLIPMVFVGELLLVTFLFAWPVPMGLLSVLVAVAAFEEAFKAAPSYAAFTRNRLLPRYGVLFGALVGVGFFAAEKGFLLASLTGLFDVPAGAAVFVTSGGAPLAADVPWGLVLALLAFPLALHAATAALTGWGAAQGRRVFWVAFATAVTVHAAYNFSVIAFIGGGLP